jgi:hypothetical protein
VSGYREVADAFRTTAHRIVWCTVATVDPDGRPRTRVLHPFWEWEDDRLVGWIATGPTPVKLAALAHSPSLSLTYWAPDHDTATADCHAEWRNDDDTRRRVWEAFASLPAPVGYDPAIVPPWSGGPTSEAFAVLRRDPYRLRVMPGSLMLTGEGELLTWRA